MNEKYKNYLLSDEWKKGIRVRILARDGRCLECGKSEFLEVHHKTYKNIFHESDDDLVTLCRSCHDAESSTIRWKKWNVKHNRLPGSWISISERLIGKISPISMVVYEILLLDAVRNNDGQYSTLTLSEIALKANLSRSTIVKGLKECGKCRLIRNCAKTSTARARYEFSSPLRWELKNEIL